jgi:hypothetical protein
MKLDNLVDSLTKVRARILHDDEVKIVRSGHLFRLLLVGVPGRFVGSVGDKLGFDDL